MERFKEALQVALSNLRANPLRSILSILGIVIGIASVITVMAFGAAARREILERVNAMGVNVYQIYAHFDEKTRRLGQLELTDVERLQRLPFVTTAFPSLNFYKEVRSHNAVGRANVKGVDSHYLEARQYRLMQGRNFSPVELEQRAAICLINDETRQYFFAQSEALGKTIYVDGTPWTVIGVYASSDLKNAFAARRIRDFEVLAALTTLLRKAKDPQIGSIEVHARPDYAGNPLSELTETLERDDPHRKGLYLIRDQRELLEKRLEIKRTLWMIGALVAGISLIVGGIGMMNVMLTSVAERTREIGIRRAVGARRKDILFQFLIESSLLSSLGGIIGLILGAALARLMPLLIKETASAPPEIEPAFLVVAVGSGVLLGIIFGLYPAIKASHLAPAEALRSE